MKNEEILNIFENFIIDGIEIPVSFISYNGDSEQYVTFQSINNIPVFCCDDRCEYSTIMYDFDIYTKGSYSKILREIKRRLLVNGWTWVEDSEDMFENDTKLYHKVTTFEIEEKE